jgi:hypothetical protein
MPTHGHFVRIAGKVTGPFDVPGLQRLVRLKLLWPAYEISSDRLSWAPAGEFEELFPVQAAPSQATAAATPPVEPPTPSQPSAAAWESAAPLALAPEPPPYSPPRRAPATIDAPPLAPSGGLIDAPPLLQPTPARRFYYSQGGATCGPAPLSTLVGLARRGALSPLDMVWAEKATIATPAAEVPELAGAFAGQPEAPALPDVPPSAALRVARSARLSALVGGIIILICLHLPFADYDGRVRWCWSVAFGDGALAAFCVLLALSGAGLCIAALRLSGVPQSLAILGPAGALTLLALVMGLASDSPGSALLVVVVRLLLPLSCAVLAGAAVFRRQLPLTPTKTAAQTVLAACGAALGAAGLAIQLIAALRDGWPSLALGLASATTLAACAAAVVAGATQLLGAARALQSAVVLWSVLATAGLGTAQLLALWQPGAVGPMGTVGINAFFLGLRLSVIIYAIVGLAGIGYAQLLMMLHASPRGRLLGWPSPVGLARLQ